MDLSGPSIDVKLKEKKRKEEKIRPLDKPETVRWINVQSSHDT
jgi:hypothetical protein